MTSVTITKTIPASSTLFTSGWTGGSVTITLKCTELILHTKTSLIKINKSKSKKTRTATLSDTFDNLVIDLKKGTDEIVIRGLVEDDATSSAWLKYWQLRAMCSTGGPLTNFTISNIQFTSSTQGAFLEDVSGTIKSDDTGDINTSFGTNIGRIEISLTIFIGDER